MVYRKISPDMQDRVIFLVRNGWQTNEVAEILGVSVQSIEHWQKNIVAVSSSSIRGRPRLLNTNVIQSPRASFWDSNCLPWRRPGNGYYFITTSQSQQQLSTGICGISGSQGRLCNMQLLKGTKNFARDGCNCNMSFPLTRLNKWSFSTNLARMVAHIRWFWGSGKELVATRHILYWVTTNVGMQRTVTYMCVQDEIPSGCAQRF